jgi:choline dehydrogenase-like flavoprotein
MESKSDEDFGNSVTLDLNPQQNDEFHTRRAYVNIQPSSRDWELWDAMDKAVDDVAKVFANGQKIDVINKFDGQLIEENLDSSELLTILPYTFFGRRWPLGMSFHEAGTLRFGDDPSESVTDANCRFHRISNAYVCGCRTFSYNRLARPDANRHCAGASARRSLDVATVVKR